MRYLLFLMLICIPLSLSAQGLDLTGRVSFRMQNVSYDENSDIQPDSISNTEYGKTALVPGLQQLLNVALFGRTREMDITLLADLRNNEWNKIEARNLNRISRFTLDMRIRNHEIILGDFFESMGEGFLQSREIRGFKYGLRAPSAFGDNSFVNFRIRRCCQSGNRKGGPSAGSIQTIRDGRTVSPLAGRRNIAGRCQWHI